jgi:SSS family solute:Na+ symporter
MLISLFIWAVYDWLVTAGGMLAATAVRDGTLPAILHSNDALLTAVIYALPVGLIGIFLAGVLATAMSTIDSYTLVAGANVAYDIYRPLLKPDATDRDLVRITKIGVVVSWTLGFYLAFVFDRLMALWVFTATFLTSTVLIPIFMGLFWKGKKKPLAGVLSCTLGLVSVIAFYIAIYRLGVANETYGTYVWSFELWGVSFDVWQEYGLFFTLPLSFIGFLIGNLVGSERPEIAQPEAQQ